MLISGIADPEELIEVWSEIVFEYSGLIKTENSDYLFNLSKEIGLLKWHIMYVDYSTIFLREKYDEDIATELRNQGYSLPESSGPDYFKALDLITELAKRKVFDLDGLIEEYDRLNKTVEGKKQSEDEFSRTVAMLSKYQGYDIDHKTVYDFAQIFNNYLSEMKVREKQLEKYR